MSESTVHPAHPEAELISEHIEGLLSAEESAELTAHLGDCPDCREIHDALVELRELLGAEPDPGPMPEDVAARIDAALAAEATRPGVAEPDGEETAGTDESADAEATPALPKSSRRPTDNRPAGRSRGRIRLRRALTTLAIFAAAGGIGLAVSSGGDLDGSASSAARSLSGAPVHPEASPASRSYDFTQSGLSGQIQQLVRDDNQWTAAAAVPKTATADGTAPSATPTPSAPGHTAAVNPGAGRLLPPGPTAPACVLNAAKQSTLPAVQGVGRYLGVQVYALLYPDKDDPAHRWDVYLVQDSCTSPVVLLQQSVPRA